VTHRTAVPADLLASLLACLLAVASGCASGPNVCKKDPITGSRQCQRSSSDPTEAAVTAGAATASWAAVGCTVNGCEPPYTCNPKTKMCERIPCEEGSNRCPPGYLCDPEDQLCK
jgi:hypothetical protein